MLGALDPANANNQDMTSNMETRNEILVFLYKFITRLSEDKLHLIVGMGVLEAILTHLNLTIATPDA